MAFRNHSFARLMGALTRMGHRRGWTRRISGIRGLCARVVAAVLIVAPPAALASDDWQPLTGAQKLRDFVSGARAEIDLRPGVRAYGEYSADGTGNVEAWGETWPRTWEVVDDTTVCYLSLRVNERNCYTFEQNVGAPNEYRITHTETGEKTLFRLIGEDQSVATRSDIPGEEGGPGAPSASEIAAELANPNTSLGTMNMNFDYLAYDGDLPDADDQSALRFSFQPSLPYPLGPDTNLYVRPLFPVIIDQDVPSADGGYDSEGVDLGDISFDALIARNFKQLGNVVLGAGVVGTFPTATDDSLGLDQWLLGPEAVVGVVRPWGVIALLVTHQWDVAGEDDFDTSVTGGQYFYAFNLSDGWQINGSPTFSYNHEADSDDAWTFPLGIGVSKTNIINGRPWKFGVQYWHYVESPDTFGPDWQIRLSITPVVALPW